MRQEKRTKIVCTIGPSCEDVSTIKEMIISGMNIARLNFSHGSYDHHAMLIKNIRAAADSVGVPVAILQDLQGPKIRVGVLPSDGVEVSLGEEIIFTTDEPYAPGRIPLDYKELPTLVRSGDRLLLCDGKIETKITDVSSSFIAAKVVVPGRLDSHKGINVPDSSAMGRSLTEKDIADVAFGVEHDVDFIALSFVGGSDDILLLRKIIFEAEKKAGKISVPPIRIIAKIERQSALDHIDDILSVVDGIMVARGDLGVEIPAARVPVVQKDLILRAMRDGKSVIVATQMLDSMTVSPSPTRAEVSDVANAVIDHTDAVMLSNETATGKYPLEAVRMMADIILETEHSPFDDYLDNALNIFSAEDGVSHTARELAFSVKARAIIVASISGDTGRMISRHRPSVPVYAVTNTERVAHQMMLSWGVSPLVLPSFSSVKELLFECLLILKERGALCVGDSVVVVSGKGSDIPGEASRVEVRVVS